MNRIFIRYFSWRKKHFLDDGYAISLNDLQLNEFQIQRNKSDNLIEILLDRFENEIPKFSPRYIGHMFSETSLPALFGHIISLIHNPNNISSESSRVGIQIEDEAIEYLSEMLGMSKSFGHFTSGGTVANFECLMRSIERVNKWLFMHLTFLEKNKNAKTLFEAAHCGWDYYTTNSNNCDMQKLFENEGLAWTNPLLRSQKIQKLFKIEQYAGPVLLVPGHKHYSWTKGASLFGLGEESIWSIELNQQGVLDVDSLKKLIEKANNQNRPIAAVVSVLGTTEMGFVDPIDSVQSILNQYKEKGIYIWHHVDAAFGGFFATMKNKSNFPIDLKNSLAALSEVDSITIDPHKLGYVPYSSGTFLARNKNDYYVKSFVAPYVQFSIDKDKGPYTLEGSRSAAGAVATWLTAKSIGFTESGYGNILDRTVNAKKDLEDILQKNDLRIRLAPDTNLNILCFCIANEGDSIQQVNKKTLLLYEKLKKISDSEHAIEKFFISKTKLYKKNYFKYLKNFAEKWSCCGSIEDLDVIRLCIMNPFFDSKELSINLKDQFTSLVINELKNI